jgi:hypothetical protein
LDTAPALAGFDRIALLEIAIEAQAAASGPASQPGG